MTYGWPDPIEELAAELHAKRDRVRTLAKLPRGEVSGEELNDAVADLMDAHGKLGHLLEGLDDPVEIRPLSVWCPEALIEIDLTHEFGEPIGGEEE